VLIHHEYNAPTTGLERNHYAAAAVVDCYLECRVNCARVREALYASKCTGRGGTETALSRVPKAWQVDNQDFKDAVE
jgi:hypothetical protein